jgi:hypothetical protein
MNTWKTLAIVSTFGNQLCLFARHSNPFVPKVEFIFPPGQQKIWSAVRRGLERL